MSGGYFDSSEWVIINLADDLQHFVDKQRMYKDGKVNPTLPTGDWDHALSDETLRNLQKLATDMRVVADRFKEADYLLSGDISEKDFNNSCKMVYEL